MEDTACMLPMVDWFKRMDGSGSDSDDDSDTSADFEEVEDASAEIDEDDIEQGSAKEMHFKSQCEKCKAAQQSPEYEKVTPSKISKWSFQVQLEGEGTYECSVTGLVFEVSEQALVRYSVLSWFKFSEFLQDSWRPAGSIFDVDVVNKDSSVLKFIHFPHSLCLAEPEHELSFRVLHVEGGHASIESTVDFTASYVKWRVSSLSPVGLIIPSSLQVKHHALVLVYKELNKTKQKDFIFHVFLASNDVSEIQAVDEQVLSSRKKLIKIYKSAACRLEENFYCLKSKPEGQIEPKKLEFVTKLLASKGFFEARFGERPPFSLFLMDSDCDEPLWSSTIREEDWNVKKKKNVFAFKKTQRANFRPRDRNNETRSTGQALSDKQLLHVAETLGQEWEQAAILLGLKNKDLDDIKADNKPVAMQKQKMLVLWKRRCPPGEATAQDLLRGLKVLEDLPVETHQLLKDMIP